MESAEQEALGFPDTSGAEVPAEPEPAPEPTIDDLRAELARERQQREMAEAQASQANRALEMLSAARPQPAPTPAPPPDPQPDPETDPQGYHAWLQRQLTGSMRTAVSEAVEPVTREMEEMRQSYRMDQLWEQFQQQYPQYRGAADAARIAFDLEFPTRQIPADRGEFMRRIARRMETIAEQLGKPASVRTGSEAKTSGLSGGSGARPAPASKPAESVKPKSLTDLVRERQRNSPFH